MEEMKPEVMLNGKNLNAVVPLRAGQGEDVYSFSFLLLRYN